jgi:biotin carboxylase
VKTLLLIGAGPEQLPGIEQARRMGLRVAVTDGNPDAPGFALADDHAVASTFDPEATVRAARALHARSPIGGVLALASDTPHTVAAVAEALGLVGPSRETARLATDKLAMKEALRAAGVPVPDFAPLASADDLRRVAEAWGFPLIVKPADSRGSRGVLRPAGPSGLGVAFETARRHSPTGRAMVERFLGGMQLSSESVVVAGRIATPGLSERNYEFLERYAPHVIENGGQMPAPVTDEVRAEVDAVMLKAATAVGLTNGTIKGDLVLHGGRVTVIELAARLSGGYFCTHQIPASTGVDLVGAAIRIALGEPVDLSALVPKTHHGAAIRMLFPPPGTCRSVSYPGDLATRPGIAFLRVALAPGDVIAPPTDSNGAKGVVVARGDTAASAVARAHAALAEVGVEVESQGLGIGV